MEPKVKRGRPKTDTVNAPVTSRIPVKTYDRLATIAIRNNVSVARVVRYAIFLFLKEDDAPKV